MSKQVASDKRNLQERLDQVSLLRNDELYGFHLTMPYLLVACQVSVHQRSCLGYVPVVIHTRIGMKNSWLQLATVNNCCYIPLYITPHHTTPHHTTPHHLH